MTTEKTSGKFITVEGIEGVGKSTGVKFLTQYLARAQINHIVTREPGGTAIAEDIRKIILSHHDEEMSQDTELLLFFASRAQHLNALIKPALESGTWVLCDRFTDASYAYQNGGRGIPEERIAILENWVQGSLQPDLTLLLHAPIDVALKRAKNRSQPDRIEREEAFFFQKVQDAYLARAKRYAHRYRLIDAARSPKNVQAQLAASLKEFIDKQ